MGRIVHLGETLVDRKEAMVLMRRSYDTIRRKTRTGALPLIKVPGSTKTWYRLKDVQLLSGLGATLVRDEVPVYMERMRQRFPHLFTP